MIKPKVFFQAADESRDVERLKASFKHLLQQSGICDDLPAGELVPLKVHMGEKGNTSHVDGRVVKVLVDKLKARQVKPFVTDTNVLYQGRRVNAVDHLQLAAEHGFSLEKLGCPVIIADGIDGKNIVSIPADYNHFKTVHVASVFEKTQGFVIFSHFKGHMVSLFGGAIKNISMGFASRAQKQRMHSDYHPVLSKKKCTRCGVCVNICPTKAASISEPDYPEYDLQKCISCAQCIAMCPEMALKIFWESDMTVFQEKLVETAAAVWKKIRQKTIVINALLNITVECDCLPGDNPVLNEDLGFVGGYHPVEVDEESLNITGADIFEKAHPGVPWQRQFSYAREIEF